MIKATILFGSVAALAGLSAIPAPLGSTWRMASLEAMLIGTIGLFLLCLVELRRL